MASIVGNSGNNTLVGTINGDEILGGDGSDILYGLGGKDVLSGGVGWVDHLYGGTNDDTYIIRDSLDIAFEQANEGNDTVTSTVSYTLGANIEDLHLLAGTYGTGNDSSNWITGNAGDNILNGGRGDDYIEAGDGNDTVIGGAGNDNMYGNAGVDTADYSHWDGLVAGQTVIFSLVAEIGNAIRAVTPRDGSQFDMMSYGNLDIVEWDSLGSFENIMGTNSDDIFQGSGNFAGSQTKDNEFWGRGGNDTFEGDFGRDTYHGGLGIDTVDYRVSAAISIDLRSGGTGGLADGDRYTGIENALGTDFNDRITGNDFDNRLLGGRGDDDINGGIGNDTIIGGGETDIEHLTGGTGRDTFVYNLRSDSNTTATRTGDFIMDFNTTDDLIDLRALGVRSADLMITNTFTGGMHFARVLEDLNHNGVADGGELSINLIVDGAANVTLQDVLI